MVSSASQIGRIELQADGDNINAWGPVLNGALQRITEMIGDSKTIVCSGSVTTLSAANYAPDEARAAALILTEGSDAASLHSIVIPSSRKTYHVFNKMSVPAQIRINAGGAAAKVGAGEYQFVVNKDGTDCVASGIAQTATVGALLPSILSATSTTSNTISTGDKTFTVDGPNKAFAPGMPLRAADAAAPGTNYMDGVVKSFSGTTLVLSVLSDVGSGTISSWAISIGSAAVNKFQTKVNGTLIGERSAINIIHRGVTGTDDSGNDEVDVTLPATIYGGGLSGQFYGHPNLSFSANGRDAIGGVMYATPIFLYGGNYDLIRLNIASATSNMIGRAGIYTIGESHGRPDALVVDTGEFSCGSAGVYQIAIDASVQTGVHFIVTVYGGGFRAVVQSVVNTGQEFGGVDLAYMPIGTLSDLRQSAGFRADGSAGAALPNPFPGSVSRLNAIAPAAYVRRA